MAWRPAPGWGAILLSVVPLAAPAKPLTLRQAVEAALAGNPELAGFEFALQAQDARMREAAFRPAPELGLEAENLLGSGDLEGTDAAEYTLALSQVLELGGKRAARVAAAEAARDVLVVDRQARQLDVVADVTRRFIVVAARQEQLTLAGDAVKLAEATVRDAERRVDAAKSPRAELSRALIAKERAQLAQSASAAELDAARAQLAAAFGEQRLVHNGELVEHVRAELLELPPPGDFAELSSRLAANPDFLRFASEARVREAELRLASSLRRPDLTVGAGIRRLEESSDQALVASVSMPLFAGRRGSAATAAARAERDLVDVEQRAAEVRVRAMLYDLHRQLERAIRDAEVLRDRIRPRAEEALGQTKYAYERGRYGYLELADAQREYLDVQVALIEAAANAHTLRAEIERLTGAALTTP
jgi:cobalt-zinc-cadmium efflux system outer membrane protein